MSLIERFPTLDPEIAAIFSALPALPRPTTVDGQRQGFEAAIARLQAETKSQLPSGREHTISS